MNHRDLVRQLFLTSGKSITDATEIKDLERFVEKFRPKSAGKELIRIGGKGDGAYLLPDDLFGISTCFSPGVDVSSRFEEELAEIYGIDSFMVDFSVNKPPIENKHFHFEKKFLGNKNDEKFIRLEDWVKNNINDNSDLILQMDIEGAEYEVIIDTPLEIFKKFRIMVIEFHSLDMLFNKNSLDMYNTKQDQLKEYFKIFYNKKMMDHKNNLDKWENSFKFQSSKFSRLFNSYLDTLKNNKNLINVSAKFKVGFRITNNDEEELFIFKMINKKKPILVKCNNINDLYDKSHMVLQIKGSLIEMAVTGAYSFEDLFNCSYIIDRFHKPFNISEKSFWKIFTEFGWFLVGSKYQKKENQLLRYQLLTSNL